MDFSSRLKKQVAPLATSQTSELAFGGTVWGAEVTVNISLSSLTSVRVGFSAVTILQPVAPRPLVPGPAGRALQLPVATFEPLSPLPSVLPAAFALHSDAVPLALRPGALVAVPTGPRINTQDLEAMTPGARVLALTLGSCADPSTVGLTLLPPPAVRPPIIKVKPASSGHA